MDSASTTVSCQGRRGDRWSTGTRRARRCQSRSGTGNRRINALLRGIRFGIQVNIFTKIWQPITKKKSSTKKKRSLADLYGVSLDDFIHVDDFVEPADLEKEDRKNTIDRLPAQVKDPKKKLAKDSKATKKIPSPIESPPPMDEAPLVDQVSTKEWESFQLHALILQGLQAQGFASPTPIQAQALPMALGSSKRDIIGAAETVGWSVKARHSKRKTHLCTK